jgi:hypothetical protein
MNDICVNIIMSADLLMLLCGVVLLHINISATSLAQAQRHLFNTYWCLFCFIYIYWHFILVYLYL